MSETEPTDLRWLVERAGETTELAVFAHALLAHLLASLGLDVAALNVEGVAGAGFHYISEERLNAEELEQLRARVFGLADVDHDRVLLRPFRVEHLSGTLYLDPVPAACRDEDELALAPALGLLRLMGALAAAREQAARDGLTGLLNRRSLAERLGEVIEQGNRYGTTFSLVMLDLDNFKWFNDTYGHAEGDALLVQLSRVIRSSVRRADIVARYGGDEFVLVLPHTDPDQADHLVRRVQRELDLFLRHYASPAIKLGVSSGISHFPADGRDADALTRRADERLYQSKQA